MMEHNGTMHYRDPEGEDHILYPTTKLDNVIGAKEAVKKAEKAISGVDLQFSDGSLILKTTDGKGTSHSKDVPIIDDTLSTSGMAADAFAVSEALDGKAPAGYGLGEFGGDVPTDNDANNALLNGVYNVYASTAHGTGLDGVLIVTSRAYNYAVQTFISTDSNMARRIQNNGVWSEWEWVNPPMYLWNEYRTTERYMGKPVYTKLINCGTIVNGKSVAHGHVHIIRHSGNVNMQNSLPYDVQGSEGWNAESYYDSSNLYIRCVSGWTGNNYTWYEQIWWID